MKKTIFAAMVMAIIMMMATAAMARLTRVPVHTTYAHCEHQIVQVDEYEIPSDRRGFEVSRHETHLYDTYHDVKVCKCTLTFEPEFEKYSEVYFDEDRFNLEFRPQYLPEDRTSGPFKNSRGEVCVCRTTLYHTYESVMKN